MLLKRSVIDFQFASFHALVRPANEVTLVEINLAKIFEKSSRSIKLAGQAGVLRRAFPGNPRPCRDLI
jgi:hypothetical protein